jgi:hypothetical protein
MSTQTTRDISFEHNYTVTVQPEMSGSEVVIDVPPSGHSRPDSLLIKVEPHRGESWFGVFRGGGLTHAGKTGVYTWPNRDKLCVTCAGTAYLVDVHDPRRYEELDAGMVTDVLPLPEYGLVAFADPWEVRAFGAAGLVWRTGRIAVDGLRITGTEGDCLKGLVDSFEEGQVDFRIDLKTGKVEGGFRLH